MDFRIIFFSALALGAAGSMHCLGMCGPIVLVLPGAGEARTPFLVQRLLYNAGRLGAYAVLGLVAGLAGRVFVFAGWQQRIGVAAGVCMILAAILPRLPGALRVAFRPFDGAFASLKRQLGILLSARQTSASLLIGFLNGFLPCGLVYTAMIASIPAGGVAGSVAFMALFGIGTTPAMLAAAYAAKIVTNGARRRITMYLPFGVAALGLLFVLRGLSLGIPFVSPNIDTMIRHEAFGPRPHSPGTPADSAKGCCN